MDRNGAVGRTAVPAADPNGIVRLERVLCKRFG